MVNEIQRIEKEMRINLRLQRVVLRFCQFLLHGLPVNDFLKLLLLQLVRPFPFLIKVLQEIIACSKAYKKRCPV